MLSGLFPFQTNSLISFHQQSSLLLHQGSTFKEPHSLVFHRKDLCDARTKPKMSSKFHMQMYPPLEGSGSQDQYYIRSSWHVEECNWECSGQSDVPLHTGIWWWRSVLHKVIMTCWAMQLNMQWNVICTPWSIWWSRPVLLCKTVHF